MYLFSRSPDTCRRSASRFERWLLWLLFDRLIHLPKDSDGDVFSHLKSPVSPVICKPPAVANLVRVSTSVAQVEIQELL
jgi:hypothetical protein